MLSIQISVLNPIHNLSTFSYFYGQYIEYMSIYLSLFKSEGKVSPKIIYFHSLILIHVPLENIFFVWFCFQKWKENTRWDAIG